MTKYAEKCMDQLFKNDKIQPYLPFKNDKNSTHYPLKNDKDALQLLAID